MEDRAIAEIEKAAHDYVDARDARMQMGEEEQRRHTKMLGVMQKHGKKHYRHANGTEVIEVSVTPKDATAKAKVKITPVDEYKASKADKDATVIEGDEPELDIDETGEVDENDDDEIEDDELDDEQPDEDGDVDEDQP